MIFDAGLINLVLYCAQQLGIALGLGAQTVMLVAYLQAIKDGVVDEKEAQFLRATRRTVYVSFVLIVGSGVAITLLHLLLSDGAVIVTPAYLFKWLLILTVIALTALLHTIPETVAEGLLGGTWNALFLVHILAPVTTWINLLTLWGVWLVGFMLVWYVLVYSTREKSAAVAVPAKSPTAKAVIQNNPVIPDVKDFKPITLDPAPKTKPIVATEALLPVEVQQPVAPTVPAQQIKLDAAPIAMQRKEPVAFSPASATTDTPFLPQVPPLQPIPVIQPQQSTAPTTTAAPPTVSTPVPTSTQTPPQQTQTTSPEAKLGLYVMPKSPDQLK